MCTIHFLLLGLISWFYFLVKSSILCIVNSDHFVLSLLLWEMVQSPCVDISFERNRSFFFFIKLWGNCICTNALKSHSHFCFPCCLHYKVDCKTPPTHLQPLELSARRKPCSSSHSIVPRDRNEKSWTTSLIRVTTLILRLLMQWTGGEREYNKKIVIEFYKKPEFLEINTSDIVVICYMP